MLRYISIERTSLPVVQEDIAEDCYLYSSFSTESLQLISTNSETSSSLGTDDLQDALDICLDQLEKLRVLNADQSDLTDGRLPVIDMPGIASGSNINNLVGGGGKSDSGFWSQPFDSYRSSMAANEDSGDVDLDAILGELNAIGDQLETEAQNTKVCPSSSSNGSSANHPAKPVIAPKPAVPQKPNFAMNSALKSVSPVATDFDLVEHYKQHHRTLSSADSPDNDSAFSDNVSCISSESGASRTDASFVSAKSSNGSLNAPSPTQHTTGDGSSAATNVSTTPKTTVEKNKIALEKNSGDDIIKLFITVHFNDEVRKSLLVDEKMDCLDICQSLAEKSETKLGPSCALVEYLPELFLERFFEDHENLVENMLMWDRDGNSKNKILYVQRTDKYHFVTRPELYLVGYAGKETEYDELSRRQLLKDYFSSHNIPPPELEGNLYLRNDEKKTWKKYWFVLRASGLYYSKVPKGKQTSSADLICLTHFETVNLYHGLNWKKKLKAPTDFGFALKLPQIQAAKGMKHIKMICVDDQATLDLWMTGIRIAKYGRHLIDNFNRSLERAAAMEEAKSEASYNSDSSAQQTPVVSRRVSAVTSADTGFEDDLTTGTIKRKPPHSNPKLPFTSMTSQLLMRNADERRSCPPNQSTVETEPLPPPPPEMVNTNVSPLSPNLSRSPPPPTAPKPANLVQRKSSLNEPMKKAAENTARHSLIPTTNTAQNVPLPNGQLPFLHELRTTKSPVVTKKVLAAVPEVHDILSQPNSPIRKPVVNGSPVPPPAPAVPTYLRTHSMSPTHRASSMPPPPPRRSDGTKLTENATNGENPAQKVSAAHPNFMADLTRVLASKKRHSLLINENTPPAEGTDYLPPPPPELLRPASPEEQAMMRVRKPGPPPPPKRSEATGLTKVK